MKRLSEDHKEIASGKIKDDEGYMAKVEMQKIMQSLEKLKKVIKSSDQQLPAWVQSKITKASDYIDIAADYLSSDVEMDEQIDTPEFRKRLEGLRQEIADTFEKKRQREEKEKQERERQEKSTPPRRSSPELPSFLNKKPKSIEDICKKHKVSASVLKKELKKGIKVEMEHTTDRGEAEMIALHHLDEIPDYYTRLLKMEKNSQMEEEKKYMSKDEDPCWKGYEMVGFKKKRGKKVPNCVPVKEEVSSMPKNLQQAKIKALEDKKKAIDAEIRGTRLGLTGDDLNEEMTRLPMKTGNMMRVLISWRNRHISCQMFFPQIKTPNKVDITYEVNKVYPGAKVISFVPCEVDASLPIIQIQNGSKNYLINNQTIGEQKENKPLNKPMRTPGEAKKFKVYVRDPKTGNIVTVRFGDPNMDIKRDDPERRKNFRARHNCDDATDKTTPKYWSCYQWRAGKKVED